MDKDKWISNKIKKLMQEKMPQKQAVAVAYSMYEQNNKMQGGGAQPYPNAFPNGIYSYPQQDFNFRPFTFDSNPSTNVNLGNFNAVNPTINPEYVSNQGAITTEYTNPPVAQIDGLNTSNTRYNNIYSNQIFNPYTGVSFDNALFGLGQSIGYTGENKGANTVRGLAAAGKILTSGARTFLSGLGYEQANQRAYNDYMQKMYNPDQAYTSYQDGGQITNAQALTGAFLPEMPVGNAEIEQGEVVKNSATGDIQTAVGEKHDNGGVNVNLPQGSKVLSDYTKIGAQKAKMFRKEFDIKVKATDTYATVMDKYNKKIGFDDVIEEETKAIEQVGQQEENNISSGTKDINMNFLSDKLQEINATKEEMKVLQDQAFETIYDAQESGKKKEEKYDENIMSLSQQYNIPPERIVELMTTQVPVMQAGGPVNVPYRIANTLENPNLYINQSANDSNWMTFGQLYESNPQQVISAFSQVHPRIAQRFFTDGQINRDNIGELQLAINESYDNILTDARNIGLPASRLAQLEADIAANRFVEDAQSVRGVDAKFGNYTATRPTYSLELVTPEERLKLNARGIRTVQDLKTQDPAEYERLLGNYNLVSDAVIGDIIPEATTDVVAQDVVNRNITNYSVPLLPQDYIMPPTPADPVYKADVSLGRIDPINVSIEPNLIEAERQRQAATNAIKFLPDSQRTAAIASLLGQTQTATNQAITAAETANAQSQFQADQFNIQQGDKQSILNEQNNLEYERRALMGLNAAQRDLQNYFQSLNLQQRQNYNDVRDLSLLSQLYPNYSSLDGMNVGYTGYGNQFTNPSSAVRARTRDEEIAYRKKLVQEQARQDAKKSR